MEANAAMSVLTVQVVLKETSRSNETPMDGAGVVVMLDKVFLFATTYGTFFQAFCKQATLTCGTLKA